MKFQHLTLIEDNEAWVQSLRWNEQGLLPAIVQDEETKAVLMMAYMNRESLQLSLERGETVFWSRSRQELWHKGATSGNTQRIVELAVDCDRDTLLIQVNPNGPACHTGTYTCFDENEQKDSGKEKQAADEQEVLDKLQKVHAQPVVADAVDEESVHVLEQLALTIAERERERPEGAYTTYLFNQGLDKILKKIGEEAAEVIIAAKNNETKELTSEVCDLMFHLLVLLQDRKVSFDKVLSEISHRHAKPRRDTYNDLGKVKE
ncbi:bifunctional phosphoribosyl-AMP cyclohydrolase/phosphoribosyl-ATP diphosphatase HisIE [Paenibacillus sp. SC116]|uniref:bifunctional phosphoribosyl-AMP cyclohydrolase/phosphoribosyl-ATP diphosphatase HisIE n=1 Tax=Paenibacillus sp. SC116 TaxID=2968986 RepID=UPI00215B2F3C|nr:bifunctional phosphoribosyl-AMP cyclohydrolase/phosphoribosyl-ATP diphosphatase HisIE [Paenibacillus sp. SC116]MCR8844888.1 bifunctional phosphoribosyl-AMP cyclohydrolase/phosphoribosyl-ATP diphosphatase HisIE [Paenibacillus sp. SC116]